MAGDSRRPGTRLAGQCVNPALFLTHRRAHSSVPQRVARAARGPHATKKGPRPVTGTALPALSAVNVITYVQSPKE